MGTESGTWETSILPQGLGAFEEETEIALSRRCCSRATLLRKVRPQPHATMGSEVMVLEILLSSERG